MTVTAEDLRDGYLGSLLLRSGFTALPLEGAGPSAPGGRETVEERLRLTRYLPVRAAAA